MKLSVIIPAFNEINTISRALLQVVKSLPYVEKQVVVVDDCSQDGTREWLEQNLGRASERYASMEVAPDNALNLTPTDSDEPGGFSFALRYHDHNQGKGAALRTGLAIADGDVMVIQDADLEYDPGDWEYMWPLIAKRRLADVIYGSRFYGRPHRSLQFHHLMANRLISFLFSVIYNQALTDVETCYKMFTREVLDTLHLTACDFGFEIEFSAQVALARRWRIYEVGINYYGRDYHDGKKIGWKDGVKALWYLVKYRV